MGGGGGGVSAQGVSAWGVSARGVSDCKTETLGSLYSHALLILIESSEVQKSIGA